MNTAPTRCSRLSHQLAWGTLSLRYVFQQTYKRRREIEKITQYPDRDRWFKSLKAFTARLHWHSHFVQKLEDEVEIEKRPQNRAFDNALPTVSGDQKLYRLQAWKTGMTGYPMIDASMRHYRKTGWLNFRSRAMVTSFAVHALRIPWQEIIYELAKFMSDYVPGIHVSQVQMQAGVTGINTIRVYSPAKQMKDHDPEARFIKSEIPELKDFSALDIENFATSDLGTYPKPIIDFAAETKIMKDTLYKIKKSPAARKYALDVYTKHGSRSFSRT